MRPCYRHWTAEEDAIIVRSYTPLKHGIHIEGRTKSAVNGRIHKLILKGLIQPATWTEEQEALLIREYPNNCASKELCQILDKPRKAISVKAMRLGLKCRQNCNKKLWGGPRLRGKRSNHFQGYEGLSGYYVGSLRRAAQERELEHPLLVRQGEGLKYLWELYLSQDKKCALSGMDIGFPEFERSDIQTASLDRIDSVKGYVEGNVQWVHKWVNIMKWDLTQEEFIDMCTKIAAHNSKPVK